MARTYNQDCILAHGLDLLGERWTFLVLRELFLGPQRFGDLQAGLPGIGANLLSKRLKELDEAGLIEAPAPHEKRAAYKLTNSGEALRPVVRSMMHWALDYFMERPEQCAARACIYSNNLEPDSVAMAIELFAGQVRDDNLNYVAHLHIDEYSYTVYYMNGEMTVRRGADAPGVACIKSDVATYMQSFRKELTLDEARARMTLEGDEKVINHLLLCIVHAEDFTCSDANNAPQEQRAAS